MFYVFLLSFFCIHKHFSCFYRPFSTLNAIVFTICMNDVDSLKRSIQLISIDVQLGNKHTENVHFFFWCSIKLKTFFPAPKKRTSRREIAIKIKPKNLHKRMRNCNYFSIVCQSCWNSRRAKRSKRKTFVFNRELATQKTPSFWTSHKLVLRSDAKATSKKKRSEERKFEKKKRRRWN